MQKKNCVLCISIGIIVCIDVYKRQPHILMIKQEIWYLLPMKREEQILMLTTRPVSYTHLAKRTNQYKVSRR